MHMADALVSPAVGGSLWAVSAGLLGWCARAVEREQAPARIPLMGVLGAFVFAAQMINITIPGTGASGHLGGGILLAALLGPAAGFITLASVLAVQALFFADGGLLAYGCNLFNLGFFPCFVAYPLVFKPLAGNGSNRGRMILAALVASVAGLQSGALGVVLETCGSGISALPFNMFVLLMLPIHLAIGVFEGLATAALLLFVRAARPELLAGAAPGSGASLRPVWASLALAAVALAGVVSWFASTRPDGLEWALGALAAPPPPTPWPAVDPGTSLAGLVGAGATLAVMLLIGYALAWRRAAAGPVGMDSA